jgi:hypothetical protein
MEEENNDNDDELLALTIQNSVKKEKLGSTLLISTEQYLFLILQQPCDSCRDIKLVNKKSYILIAGLSTKVLIKCQVYKMVKEFSNELAEVNFNACFVTAGLIGGINRQALQMTFMCVGVILQLCKASYHNYQAITFEKIVESAEVSAKMVLQNVIDHYKTQEKHTLPLSFDCSWSHVRNAQQASGEIIYDGKDVKGKFLF